VSTTADENKRFVDEFANPHSWLLTADNLHEQATEIYQTRSRSSITTKLTAKGDSSGEVWPPVLEIVHPETPEQTIEVAFFMRDVLNCTLSAGENLMAFLASTNMQHDHRQHTMVMEFPPEKRRSPHVKYYHAINLGGEMCPIG
jgi:hypothetical protein